MYVPIYVDELVEGRQGYITRDRQLVAPEYRITRAIANKPALFKAKLVI